MVAGINIALELWKHWFEWSGIPWEQSDFGDEECFFCGETKPNHVTGCVFIEAEKLLKELGELEE